MYREDVCVRAESGTEEQLAHTPCNYRLVCNTSQVFTLSNPVPPLLCAAKQCEGQLCVTYESYQLFVEAVRTVEPDRGDHEGKRADH